MERILRLQLYRYYGGVGSDRPLMAAKAIPPSTVTEDRLQPEKGSVYHELCSISVF